MLDHVSRWLRHERVLPIAAVLACVLCAPALFEGLVLDDVVQRQFVLAHLHDRNASGAWWDMFFMPGHGGPAEIVDLRGGGHLPWWVSLHLRGAFLRPLAVVSHYFDYLIWPDSPWLMHLHN